jgi:hypothetical protein
MLRHLERLLLVHLQLTQLAPFLDELLEALQQHFVGNVELVLHHRVEVPNLLAYIVARVHRVKDQQLLLMALGRLLQILELAGRVQLHLLIKLLTIAEELEKGNEGSAKVLTCELRRCFKVRTLLLDLGEQSDEHEHEAITRHCAEVGRVQRLQAKVLLQAYSERLYEWVLRQLLQDEVRALLRLVDGAIYLLVVVDD